MVCHSIKINFSLRYFDWRLYKEPVYRTLEPVPAFFDNVGIYFGGFMTEELLDIAQIHPFFE